jgi:plastocyanin
MHAYSLRKLLITLTHTMHTLRGMKNLQSLLAALFVSTLAFTSVACDDETEPKKDAAPADRSPDLAVTEGGVDRTPDTSTTEVAPDKAPDTTTPDGGADKAPDTATDGPADVAADMAADKAPDQAVDLPPDQAPDTSPDTTADVNPTGLNLCTVYVDRTGTGDDRSISFSMATLPTDVERCMRVKAGQTVTFTTSSFITHPLAPSGGDTPSPIRPQVSGSGENFVMSTPGVYGYKCTTHATMTGAILVVP